LDSAELNGKSHAKVKCHIACVAGKEEQTWYRGRKSRRDARIRPEIRPRRGAGRC
jgi:hypothetical protein